MGDHPLRVDTPPIQASWISATGAFSELLWASRKRWEVAALPQLRDTQLQRLGYGSQKIAFPSLSNSSASTNPMRGANVVGTELQVDFRNRKNGYI
jgi:hypothetical protein